jgi:hypothetical protein
MYLECRQCLTYSLTKNFYFIKFGLKFKLEISKQIVRLVIGDMALEHLNWRSVIYVGYPGGA